MKFLVNLGYQYVTPAEALAARGGKAGNVLLKTQKRSLMQKVLTGQWRLPIPKTHEALSDGKKAHPDGHCLRL